MKYEEAGEKPAFSVISHKRDITIDDTAVPDRYRMASGSDLVARNEGESSNELQVQKEIGKSGGESRSKADILAKNRIKGRAFEKENMLEFCSSFNYAVEQVTIKTNQGKKIRVDAIGIDKNTGNAIIKEFKSSGTAPLTKNQMKGFPELQKSGSIVVGKGKGIFTKGYQIPPTKVEIVRSNN